MSINEKIDLNDPLYMAQLKHKNILKRIAYKVIIDLFLNFFFINNFFYHFCQLSKQITWRRECFERVFYSSSNS